MVRRILFLSSLLFWGSASRLEAYTVTATPLTDKTYTPIDAQQAIFSGAWDAHRSAPGEEDLATITLRFDPQEIGSDNSAAMTLGRREAAKIGATAYYLVSGSEREGSKDIATRTFHLTRMAAMISISPTTLSSSTPRAALEGVPAPETYYRDIRATPFGKLYFDWIDARKNMTPDEKVVYLRVREKKVRENGMVVRHFFDVKTDKGLSSDEVQRRFILYIGRARPTMIAKNAELYRSHFPELQKINAAYMAQNPSFNVIDWPLPPAEIPAPNTTPPLPRVM